MARSATASPVPGLNLSLGLDQIAERVRGCLPAGLRRLLAGRDRRLLVMPEPHQPPARDQTQHQGQLQPQPLARLSLKQGDEVSDLGSLALSEGAGLPPAALPGRQDRDRRTVLRLPADQVLTRRVSLPAQVRDNLPQVVRVELDRLSPFSAEQALFDYRLLPAAKGAPRVLLDLAVTRRDWVTGWLARLADAGVPASEIDWEGAWPRANLLPAEQRPKRRGYWLDPGLFLGILVVVLVAAVLITPLWQKSRRLADLEAEVRRVRAEAIAVDDLRQELERARAGSTAVLDQKRKQPRVTEMLRELTDRIPDDTWVQSLEYRDGEVQLRGESSQATALIGLLESAEGIEGVSFRSPVTQVARTGKERYNLAFTYRPEAGE